MSDSDMTRFEEEERALPPGKQKVPPPIWMGAAAAARGRCLQIEVKFCNWLKRLQGAQTFTPSFISERERERERGGRKSVSARVKSFAYASLAKVLRTCCRSSLLEWAALPCCLLQHSGCATFAVTCRFHFEKIPFVSISIYSTRERTVCNVSIGPLSGW